MNQEIRIVHISSFPILSQILLKLQHTPKTFHPHFPTDRQSPRIPSITNNFFQQVRACRVCIWPRVSSSVTDDWYPYILNAEPPSRNRGQKIPTSPTCHSNAALGNHGAAGKFNSVGTTLLSLDGEKKKSKRERETEEKEGASFGPKWNAAGQCALARARTKPREMWKSLRRRF